MNPPFLEPILGQDNTFLAVIEQASKAAKLNKPVLIMGERGTGKELIAHRLHYLSTRWQEAFITLNCAALNEQLLDSELFGHEAGAFTGAQKRHQGRFERADGGTLFLDELGNAPMLVQEKLLRVIEYGQLERVGGSQSLKVDVRVVCATNENLPEMAKLGEFREDLLDRLAFDVINLPPLRQRKQDILLLANHFARQMCCELAWEYFPGFSEYAIETLLDHSWPGNIRELKNAVERSIYRHEDKHEQVDNIILNPFLARMHQTVENRNLAQETSLNHPLLILPQSSNMDFDNLSHTNASNLPLDLQQYLQDEKQKYIQLALQQAKYHHKTAAELLGLTYHQFRAMIRKNNAN